MRTITDWLSRRRPSSEPILGRRRIDLGSSPPSYPIYVIGDIHGCINELKSAEARIAADMTACGRKGMIILLGDYIDRGPASRLVIDHLVRPSELGLKRIALCGNHDDTFHKFLKAPERHSEWLGWGGEQTLISYGIDLSHLLSMKSRPTALRDVLVEAVPASHRQFLAELPVCLRIGDLFFVHAGIKPGIPLDMQEDQDMLWIREPFLTEGPMMPLLVIHGHTPQPEADVGPGRIGIDTGAFFTGKLTVLKIDEGRASVL